MCDIFLRMGFSAKTTRNTIVFSHAALTPGPSPLGRGEFSDSLSILLGAWKIWKIW
jgi:hypothetical protein